VKIVFRKYDSKVEGKYWIKTTNTKYFLK